MANESSKSSEIVLSMEDLRAVAGYAAECAQQALAIFESAHPADSRPCREGGHAQARHAILAHEFAGGVQDGVEHGRAMLIDRRGPQLGHDHIVPMFQDRLT